MSVRARRKLSSAGANTKSSRRNKNKNDEGVQPPKANDTDRNNWKIMKTKIQHIILNSGKSQLSRLRDQSESDLLVMRAALGGEARSIALNFVGLELQARLRDGWAHVEFRRNDKAVLATFIAGGSNDADCWRAGTERFYELLSGRLVPSLPAPLTKPNCIPWCASIFRREFGSLGEDEIRTLAFLERTVAWAVFFESRPKCANLAQDRP